MTELVPEDGRILMGQMKAMRDYLNNAESFMREWDIKLVRENLVMLRDELYDALLVLAGDEEDDGS